MTLICAPSVFIAVRRLGGRVLLPWLCGAMLAGCATDALKRAPATHDQPWRPISASAEATSAEASTLRSAPQAGTERAAAGFGVMAPAGAVSLPIAPQIALDAVYDMPMLIDIAQRSNPETRLAWNRAREAALAVGMAEATFLPMLSANVVGGYQRTSAPSPLVIGGRRDVDTDVSGIVPALALSWLVFDFGQRAALLDGAEQLSFAANVLFNAAHQQIIRDVTTAYYHFNAARARKGLAVQALRNRQEVARAAQKRLDAGLATTVELAVARQGVAQARLQLVNSEGEERNAYLFLLKAVGLPATMSLTIAEPRAVSLPAATDPITDEVMRQALSRRPDIAASYAAMKAADAAVTAARADFMPKVYFGAVAARSRNSFDIRGLPAMNLQSSTTGVLLGVTLPLYDGGLRRARMTQEQARADQASELWRRTQRDALHEMVAADTDLRSALQSYETATELVSTADTAYAAALEAYRNGVGTITLATEAATDLLDARLVQSDAHAASLMAAANLAFVMGQMNAGRESWLAPGTVIKPGHEH